jgi:DNA invertase Pin-like site-specific DNA recombinase
MAYGISGKIADLIGAEAALLLIEAHGGQRIHVPKNARPNTKLAKLIGVDALAKLCALYGGIDVYIRRERHIRIKLLRAQGHTYSEIARTLGCSQKTVHANLQRAGLTNVRSITARVKARLVRRDPQAEQRKAEREQAAAARMAAKAAQKATKAERDALALALFRGGAGILQIASQLGVDRQTVWRSIARAREAPPSPSKTPQET